MVDCISIPGANKAYLDRDIQRVGFNKGRGLVMVADLTRS